jgi:hypothetical protein
MKTWHCNPILIRDFQSVGNFDGICKPMDGVVVTVVVSE